MRESHYVLGVDIGDDTVAAAVCRSDGELWGDAAALWLGDGSPLGPATVDVAPDGTVRPVGPSVAPGARTAKHVMARVGATAPLYVGGRGIDAADVAAALVAHVRSVAEAQEGAAPARTVLAVPPSWGPHRRSLLLRAVRSVCPDVGLVSSAVASTYHHVSTEELPPAGVVAVYDLGASFLDTAIVGPAADGTLHHLAPPPAPLAWGGRDVDDALLGHLLRCREQFLDGAEQATPRAGIDGLRERAVAAKEALTVDTVVCLDLPLPTGPVRVTREELDELMDQRLEESVAVMAATLAGAGLTPHDLDGIVLAGGAARMPLVAERLSAELGVPVVVDAEPELAAARGAARLAAAARLAPGPDVDAEVPPGTTHGQAADGHVAASAGDGVAPEDPRGGATADETLGGARPEGSGRRGRRLLPGTRAGTAQRGHTGTARPARSPAGRPPGSPRVPTGPRGERGFTRALLVTAMFVGLVALMSSLVAVISDVRTAPAAQGQVATPPNSPAAATPPEEGDAPAGGAAATEDSLAETGSSRAAAARTTTPAQGGTRTSATTRAPGTTAPPSPGTTAPVASSPVDVPQPATVSPTTPPTTPPVTEPPPPTTPPVSEPPPITTPPVSEPPPTAEPPVPEPPVESTQDADPGTGAEPVDGTVTDGTTP